MTFNASRLTSFALISAIETDARSLVTELESDGPVAWSAQSEARAAERLVRDRGLKAEPSHSTLIHYLDFPDSFEILLRHKERLSAGAGASVRGLGPKLAQLSAVRNRVAHNRPLEINDLPLLADVADDLVRQSKDTWAATAATVARLQKDPSFVLGLTIRLRSDPIDEPFHNLPVPDFDETGFFGRENALRRVKQALLSPWPAVSILGDGGIGKTSIALKAVYDLLDDPAADFDAIVWTTAKARTLTSSEIERINDAILSSLGLFEDAVRSLGAPKGDTDDPVAELLEYLREFKVLLVLDNLETVMDQRLRDFLRDLPFGSKVLITSRIGLQMENPIKLEPMTSEESRQLLLALAHRRNVGLIKGLEPEAVDKLVANLKGHPLYIKWLVAGVQAGKRPNEILSNNDLLLDYCMFNVFDNLTPTSRDVLQSMQVMRGARLQAELAFLNEMNAQEIQTALLELMATNFVTMTQSGIADLDASYEVGDFASAYLARKQPLSPTFRESVLARADELSQLGIQIASQGRSEKYDPKKIDVRGHFDVPVARLLIDAQRQIKANNFDHALELCREAQNLSPGYHEPWRVEAMTHALRRDPVSAETAYEQATQLAAGTPSGSIVDYHFATFLIDNKSDYVQALGVLQRAARLDPEASHIVLLIAYCYFELQRYREALDVCTGLMGRRLSENEVQVGVRLGLRATVFGCESLLWSGKLSEALDLIEGSIELVSKVPIEILDDHLADWLLRIRETCARIDSEGASDDLIARRAAELGTRVTERIRAASVETLTRRTGHVVRVLTEKRFAFVSVDGVEHFLHMNDLVERQEWGDMAAERLVAFTVVPPNAKGPRVRYVRLLD